MTALPYSVTAVAVAGLLALGSTSCGGARPGTDPPSPVAGAATTVPTGGSAADHPGRETFERPPPVTVRYGGNTVGLTAHAFCYGRACIDGGPPDHPPKVGSPAEVEIDFPLRDWSFEAIFEPAGVPCGRIQTVALHRTARGSFGLRPAGHAGGYDVTLFGRGRQGDLVTVFRWSTPSDGPLPVPAARLALLSDNAGRTGSYGVELAVSNLAETPAGATATITVTAANRESLTFTATPATEGCQPEGTAYWDGPDTQGTAAANLGPPPFTYRVVLTLGGSRYVATATWPAEVIRGNEPSVALRFVPALPALT